MNLDLKSAILTLLEVLNFAFCEFLHFMKAEITKLTKFRAPKMTKKADLDLLDFLKIDFT